MTNTIQKTISQLEINNMQGFYVQSVSELHELLKTLIKEGSSVGSGDSVTLEETQVFDFIKQGPYQFNDKHQKHLSSEEKREIYIKNFDVDTFLTSTNAITTNGELFNIDGNGSRVAPMIYGPKQVIVIVGTNKITSSIEEAIQRTRQIAAPMDAKRLGKNTPCSKLNKCIDCKHKERICNDFVLIARQFKKNRIKVIFIEGNYGY